jgi:hypothetical protein
VLVRGVVGLALATLALPGWASADVLKRDHVRLGIEYLELASAKAVDVSIRVEGRKVWVRRLPAQTMHVNLGPVVARTGVDFSVTVATPDGQVLGAATLADTSTDGSESVKQGEVKRLIITARGVDVWSIPDVRVSIGEALTSEARVRLSARLLQLNRALIDRSDGQIRIEQFTLQPSSRARDATAGSIHIGKCKGECPRAVGTPKNPGSIRVPSDDLEPMVRGFAHAYLAVPATRECWGTPAADETEVLGPDEEDEDLFDCRSHMATTLRSELGIRLLGGDFTGPEPMSRPHIRAGDAQQVDFTDDP